MSIHIYVIIIAKYVVTIGIVLPLLQLSSNTLKLSHILLQLSSYAIVWKSSAFSLHEALTGYYGQDFGSSIVFNNKQR
jgi:hypothetical protein